MVNMPRSQASTTARNIGQQSSSSQEVVQSLTEVLADTYSLAFKTQLCRWNIAGPTFYTLYSRLGGQCKSLSKSANNLGNRIRAINPNAQVNFGQFTSLRQAAEQNNVPNSWQEIIQDLQNDHQQLAEKCQNAIETCQTANDAATTYLLLKRANYHEKTVSKLNNVLAAPQQASNM